MEQEDAYQNRPHGSNASPYGIGCAQRQSPGRFGKKTHADNRKNDETANPCPPFPSGDILGTAEAVSETDLAEAGDN